MERILLIDRDRDAAREVRRQGLAQGLGVALAGTVCEGVRILLTESVSLILVDATLMRFPPREHAELFERVAPGVPVAVTLSPATPFEARLTLELAGFHVVPRPVALDDVLDAVVASVVGA